MGEGLLTGAGVSCCGTGRHPQHRCSLTKAAALELSTACPWLSSPSTSSWRPHWSVSSAGRRQLRTPSIKLGGAFGNSPSFHFPRDVAFCLPPSPRSLLLVSGGNVSSGRKLPYDSNHTRFIGCWGWNPGFHPYARQAFLPAEPHPQPRGTFKTLLLLNRISGFCLELDPKASQFFKKISPGSNIQLR